MSKVSPEKQREYDRKKYEKRRAKLLAERQSGALSPETEKRIQAQRAASNRARAKKLGLTVEQYEARLEAGRRWKERNKERRTKNGYTGARKPAPTSFYKMLKEKHKQWEGTRLEKSLKPPIFLSPELRELYAMKRESE
jgi:hypothetical protein